MILYVCIVILFLPLILYCYKFVYKVNFVIAYCLVIKIKLAAYYSRVRERSRFGYYKQLIGRKWLFLTVKQFRNSTIIGRGLYNDFILLYYRAFSGK